MKRKLVQQGAATMMISIPAKWIRENGLKKGDEINLDEREKDLLITAGEIKKGKKEVTIAITPDNAKDVRHLLTHSYREGFDRIILKNVNPSLIKEIRSLTEKLLLGFELVEKSESSCIIENISEPNEGKYEVMLNKVFLIMRESLEMVKNDFEAGKLQNMHEIEEIRDQQDRLIIFCKRMLLKNSERNAATEWELLTFLMHIQHSLFYLYQFSSENKIKADGKMVKSLGDLCRYFDLLDRAYRNSDIRAIHELNNLKKTYHFGMCLELIEKAKGKNAVVYSYLREMFRLIQVSTSPVLGDILEKNLSQRSE